MITLYRTVQFITINTHASSLHLLKVSNKHPNPPIDEEIVKGVKPWTLLDQPLPILHHIIPVHVIFHLHVVSNELLQFWRPLKPEGIQGWSNQLAKVAIANRMGFSTRNALTLILFHIQISLVQLVEYRLTVGRRQL